MLTSYLQETIDNKWNNCWPVSDLRPLAVLDLISYIFFIKKLDDRELIRQKLKVTEGDNFVYTREMKEFNWSNFKNMDAQQIHDLFKKQYGFIDLLNQYGHLDSLYSDFFKAPLLLEPTPKLLFNAIGIINIIEASDQNTQGAIVDYLFSKLERNTQNGQEFIPQYVSRLMISIAEPGLKEVILDPSAGNGSLLIDAYKYVADINSPLKNGIAEAKLRGMESDLMQLRLGAMNMMLHGIKDPDIRISPANDVIKSPALILSNLVFPEIGNIIAGNLEKEIDLLNQILETLQSVGRAVILVPQTLLKSDIPAIVKVRKNIINHYNLQGIINLPPKSNSLFSGAGILILNKDESVTTNVWFCKLEKGNKKSGETAESFNSSYEIGSPELNDILNKWKHRKDKQTDNPGNSFYISASFIETNNYNLNFSDYKFISQTTKLNKETENTIVEEKNTLITAKKENLHHFFEGSIPLQEEKRKRKLLPVLMLFLILIISGVALYAFYFKDNTLGFSTKSNGKDSVSYIRINNSSMQLQPQTTQVNKPKPLKKLPASLTKTGNSHKEKGKSITINKAAPVKDLATSVTKTETLNDIDAATKYTVINKTWFHYAPDSAKRKSLYLEPRKNLVLIPRDEENGFVYVVYINKNGESTRGWLNKKDLQAIE